MDLELEKLKLAYQDAKVDLDRTKAELAQMTAERDGYKEAYDIMGPELGYLRGYTAPVVRSTVAPSRLGKPSIFVVTLPKSGTVFIGHTIKKSLSYDFTSVLVTPTFPKNIVWLPMADDFQRGGMVSVSHMEPDRENYRALVSNGILKLVLHVRDPRAAWWSWYHFIKGMPRGYVPMTRDWDNDFFLLPELEQKDRLIESFFTNSVRWLSRWSKIITEEPRVDCLMMSHEELASDGPAYFRKVFDFYGIEAEPQLVAKGAGTHFRKGDNDDWRSGVTEEQVNRMASLMPDELCEFYGFRR